MASPKSTGDLKDAIGADGATDRGLVGREDSGQENLRRPEMRDRKPIESEGGGQAAPSGELPTETPVNTDRKGPQASGGIGKEGKLEGPVDADSLGKGNKPVDSTVVDAAPGVQALQTNGTSATSGSAEVDGVGPKTADISGTEGSGPVIESASGPKPENNASQVANNDGVLTEQGVAAVQVDHTNPSKRTEDSAN